MSTDVMPADAYPHLAGMIAELSAAAEIAESTAGLSTADFVASIMENILAAESFDDIFAAQQSGGVSGKNFVNRPFVILSAEDIIWRKSTVADARFPLYAQMTVYPLDAPETPIQVSCGGETFVAVMYALLQRDYFNAEKNPEGRSFQLTSTDSTNGAYLSLLPFKMPVAPSSKKRG